jgi:cell division initiation protein
MIDMTPLDVRNKRRDFKRIMRGYDPTEVDVFLELVAERLEALFRENLQLRERTQTLQDQVSQQAEREHAVQEALVTAQGLRADIQAQSRREAEHVMKEAEGESRRHIADAEAEARRIMTDTEAQVREQVRGIERRVENADVTMEELERRRARFLREMSGLLNREMDVVRVEQNRAPFEERASDLDLGSRRSETAAESATDHGGSTDPLEAESVMPEAVEHPIDVTESHPSVASSPSTPLPDAGSGVSSLEVGLMTGAADSIEQAEVQHTGEGPDRFAAVPDLRTVLAESGEEDPAVDSPAECAPPPEPGIQPDNLILFDPEERDRKR